MKPEHIQAIKQVPSNNTKLEETIVELLTADTNKLTFEELMECCGPTPPVTINADVLYQIAIRYDNGNNKLEQNYSNAAKLFKYLASTLKYPWAYDCCGVYLLYGRSWTRDLVTALQCFLHFLTLNIPNNVKISRCYHHIAKIYLEQNNLDEALKYALQYINCNDVKLSDKQLFYSTLADIYSKKGDISKAISTWLLIPDNSTEKENANRQVNLLLQTSLNNLYPLAGRPRPDNRIDKDLPEKLAAMTTDDSKKSTQLPAAWTLSVDKSLLDGYEADSEALQTKERVLSEHRKINKKMEKLSKQIKEGEESGLRYDQLQLLKNTHSNLGLKLHEINKTLEQTKKEYDDIRYAAFRKEMARQYSVQKRFFDPKRTHKKQTQDIALERQNDRFTSKDTDNPPNFENIPTRRLITAERSTVEASVGLIGFRSNFNGRNQLCWIPKQRNRECIKLGKTEIKYLQDPGTYGNHLGNYLMDGIGTYDEIIQTLHKLTSSTLDAPHYVNEKKLAVLMLRYSKTGKIVTAADLKDIKQDITEDETDQINRIFYHILVKEIARRMPCESEEYDIPVAIIQARAIKLIAEGYLRLADVFSQDGPYGVVTGIRLFNNHEEVKIKILRINRLYVDEILKRQYILPTSPFFRQHPTANLVSSREQLHLELKQTFGGDSDTEGDGYHSPLETGQRI